MIHIYIILNIIICAFKGESLQKKSIAKMDQRLLGPGFKDSCMKLSIVCLKELRSRDGAVMKSFLLAWHRWQIALDV